MKKYCLSFLIAFGLSLAFNDARAQEVQRYTYDAIEGQTAAIGQSPDLSFFNGSVIISLSDKQVSQQPRVDVRQLGIVPEAGMEIPEGYRSISGIYQIDFNGFPVTQPVPLLMTYTSSVKFDKSVMQYDEAKGNWKIVPSVTNLSNSSVNLALTKSKAIVAVVETDSLVYGHASWYRFKKCNCAASPDYPKGTKLLVTNLNKNQAIVVKVNDWGPERDLFPERVIDLDLVAFQKLGKKGMGVLKNIMVVPFHTEDFSEKESKDLLAGNMVQFTSEKIAELKPVATEAVAASPVPAPQIQIPAPAPAPVPVVQTPEPVVQEPAASTNGWTGVGYYFLNN